MGNVSLESKKSGRASSPILLGGFAALLLAAIGFVVLGQAITPTKSFQGSLQSTFPAACQLSEWEVRVLPVAESAEMQRAVKEMLNFDQAAYARYNKGSVEVSLYAAYWSPGRMSHRLIAVHTPDVCWIGAGWERIEGRRTDLLPLADQWGSGRLGQGSARRTAESLNLLALRLLPWEYREFRLGERIEYVVFLHLLGGRVLGYGFEGVPPWYSVIGDLLERGLSQREEQFFVRISGNRPLPELLATEPVQLFLKQFEREALVNNLRSTNGRS